MLPASIGSAGSSQPHDNMMPYLCVSFIISLFGVFPSRSDTAVVMPQGLFRLEHPALGALDIFLVPLRRVAEGVEYVATFN